MSINEELPELPIADIYRQALNLFQDKDRWAQHYYNYDKDGNKCNWAEGYSFCAIGALCYFGNGHMHKALCCLQRVSEYLYNNESIQFVNDNPDGYNNVIKALQVAAELWNGIEPTDDELSMSIPTLLEVRSGKSNKLST